MWNELLKTEADAWYLLNELEYQIRYKAQEGEDLKNQKGADALKEIACAIKSKKSELCPLRQGE